MFRFVIPRSILVMLAIGAFCAPLFAQDPPAPGTLQGRVTLAIDGTPVHGAAIIVVGARRTATTSDDGSFAVANVPAGTYEVIAQREHLSAERQTVTVAAGETVTINFSLAIEALHEEVAVTASASGASTTFDSFSSVTSLDSLDLAINRGTTIADTLANQPGVSLRSFGPGNARPIIRGFDGDRVLIMQDGVRTGDLSSQSGDHGVSIDPAGLERLEVVKGPATLLYGSNAIGGVVNAITPQETFRATPFTGTIGGFSLDTGSANGQVGGSGNVQYGSGPWTAWAGGGARRAGDYASPAGTVENSGNELRTIRAGAGWTGTKLFASIAVQAEDNRFGVPFAGELHGHAHEGEDEEDHEGHEHEDLAINIESQRREVRVDTGLRNLDHSFLDNVKITFAATSYGQDELETVGGTESLGTHFDNDTQTARVELEQKRMGRLTGRIGADLLRRDYTARGEEALSPPTRQTAVSGFAYEELALGRSRLQFGGRVERNAYTPDARPEVDEDHEGHEHDGEEHVPPPVRNRVFTAASGSFGVHTDVGRTGAFVVNVTTASRAPALEELFNFGPHAGNIAFEIGNPDLDVERSLGVDVSLRRRADRLSGELNLYLYDIANFVYLDVSDEMVDGLREATFQQADSRFVGADGSVEIGLGGGRHLEAGVSMVRAELTATGESLPRIPPVSGRLRLELPWKGVTFSPEVVASASQRRVFRDETTTGGHVLVNFGASYFLVRGHATHAITLKGHNLLDTEYRTHTSFLKDFAPEMGRGVKLTYTVRFF